MNAPALDPIAIIQSYYPTTSKAYNILIRHSESVARMALDIIAAHPQWKLDQQLAYQAAMLHDIGIFKCYAPDIGCTGEHPYICHGFLGAELLRELQLPLHARVAERHTGTGLSCQTIIKNKWPLPHRDMMPTTLLEQIICFADKFYSKSGNQERKSIHNIQQGLLRYSTNDYERFNTWCQLFL